MDIEIVKQLALGVVPPGLLGLVLFALLWRRRQWEPTRQRAALMSLAMGLGFVPMAALIYGGIKFPPASADQWLAPIAALFGVAGAVIAFVPSRIAALCIRVSLLILFALVSAPWLAKAAMTKAGALNALLTFAAFAAISLSTLVASQKLHKRISGPLPVFLSMSLLGAMSQVLVLAYSGMKLGQGVGIFAAMLGAALLVSFFRPRLSFGRGALDAPVLASTTFFFQGFVRADEVPHAAAYVLLIAISPWLALVPDVGPFKRLTGWKSVILRIAMASAPLVIALTMGKAATDADLAGS